MSNLRKRNVLVIGCYCMCTRGEQSVDHSLLHCKWLETHTHQSFVLLDCESHALVGDGFDSLLEKFPHEPHNLVAFDCSIMSDVVYLVAM